MAGVHECPFKVGDKVDVKAAFKQSDIISDEVRLADYFEVLAIEPREGWPVSEWFLSLKTKGGPAGGEISKWKVCELVAKT